MELPHSRPLGTEGRKPTHDFLSLYGHSTVQQDPRPPPQGGFLKTHDFLQVGKINAKEESTVEISSTVEKPPPPSSSVEHILPGGIGTYSISHISYFGQKVPKPEGSIFTVAQAISAEKNDENSNCSSHTGSGFTLWEESAVKKGKTRKENAGERHFAREATVNVGQWASQSSSNNNSHPNSFSSLSCSQPAGLKSNSFMEMIKSAKGNTHDVDFDDEEEFILKKENSPPPNTHNGELGVKVDGKRNDQKPNTPRSKHSATEQRRRSKINDRFQMLREVIPHSDQKRDKASFLLEVIEYIQFLQEKVQKYEGPYVRWNQEPEKLAPWRNNHKPAESNGDQSRGINNGSSTALVFAAKLDEKKVDISPAVESDMSIASTFKTVNHQPGITNKAMPFPISLQPNCYNPVRNGSVAPPLQPRLASDAAENMTSQQPQALISHPRSCTGDIAVSNDKLKEQELPDDGGTTNISTVYSQGLLNTLSQALQSSGVDLSQASISVQIELGKRATGRSNAPASIIKDNEVLASNQGTTRSRDANGREDSNQVRKKLKT